MEVSSNVNPGIQLASVVSNNEDKPQEHSPASSRSSTPSPFSATVDQNNETHEPTPPSQMTTTRKPNFVSKSVQSLKLIFAPSAWTMPRFRLVVSNIAMAACGLHDGQAGALIPYIQENYNLSYMLVSLLFVGQCVGYLSASFANTFLTDSLGMGKVLTIGAVCQIIGYIFLSTALPFPAFCVGYAISGFGIALQDAQANVYAANLPNSSSKLGWIHASYGLGAFASPLFATALASSGVHFNFYYVVLIGIIVIDLALILAAFRLKPDPRDYEISKPSQHQQDSNTSSDIEMRQTNENVNDNENCNGHNTSTTSQETQVQQQSEVSSGQKVLQVIRNRAAVIGSLFLVIYVGSEVSMGGWIVSYLLDHRDGNSSAGYVSSGFFGGLTLGRVALLKVSYWLGERNAVWLYLAICIGLEFVVWFAPLLVVNAVSASFVGFFLGPIYPIVISIMTKILPRSLHSAAIGFAAAFGQTGSAIFPFITGSLAQELGVLVLHPIMLILMAIMIGLWFLMPKVNQRSD